MKQTKKLLTEIDNLYKVDKLIPISVLERHGVVPPSGYKSIVIGNYNLYRNSWTVTGDDDHCQISINDKDKNSDCLWIDKAITKENIISSLKEYNLPPQKYKTQNEKWINMNLANHLKKYFTSVSTNRNIKDSEADIILGGNHNFLIELKLARNLQKGFDRAFRQLYYHSKEFNRNTMIMVFGLISERYNPSVNRIEERANELKASFYYKTIA